MTLVGRSVWLALRFDLSEVYMSFSDMPGVSSVHISAPEVRAKVPGFTVLYKGGRITRLRAAFDANHYMTDPQHLAT